MNLRRCAWIAAGLLVLAGSGFLFLGGLSPFRTPWLAFVASCDRAGLPVSEQDRLDLAARRLALVEATRAELQVRYETLEKSAPVEAKRHRDAVADLQRRQSELDEVRKRLAAAEGEARRALERSEKLHVVWVAEARAAVSGIALQIKAREAALDELMDFRVRLRDRRIELVRTIEDLRARTMLIHDGVDPQASFAAAERELRRVEHVVEPMQRRVEAELQQPVAARQQ